MNSQYFFFPSACPSPLVKWTYLKFRKMCHIKNNSPSQLPHKTPSDLRKPPGSFTLTFGLSHILTFSFLPSVHLLEPLAKFICKGSHKWASCHRGISALPPGSTESCVCPQASLNARRGCRAISKGAAGADSLVEGWSKGPQPNLLSSRSLSRPLGHFSMEMHKKWGFYARWVCKGQCDSLSFPNGSLYQGVLEI